MYDYMSRRVAHISVAGLHGISYDANIAFPKRLKGARISTSQRIVSMTIPASHILGRAQSRFAAILPSVVVSTTTCNVSSVFKVMCTGIYCQIVFLTVNPRCACKPPLPKGERPFCLPVVSCSTGESPRLVRPRFSTLVAAPTSCRSLIWTRIDGLMPCTKNILQDVWLFHCLTPTNCWWRGSHKSECKALARLKEEWKYEGYSHVSLHELSLCVDGFGGGITTWTTTGLYVIGVCAAVCHLVMICAPVCGRSHYINYVIPMTNRSPVDWAIFHQ